MTEKLQVYKCSVCGIVVEALEGGAGECVCCGQPMAIQAARTEDAATEKHVPFIEQVEGGVKVRVGQNAAHPMAEDHYIQWIAVVCCGAVYRQFLNPGDAPEAFFPVTGDVTAFEYCNLHGLWKG